MSKIYHYTGFNVCGDRCSHHIDLSKVATIQAVDLKTTGFEVRMDHQKEPMRLADASLDKVAQEALIKAWETWSSAI